MSQVWPQSNGSHYANDDVGAQTSRPILTPLPDAPASRLVVASGGREITGVVIAVITSYVLMAILMVALGLLITHVLKSTFVVTWDHHVSLWFDHHRTAGWNKASGYATDIADTFPVVGVAAFVTIVLHIKHWGRQAWVIPAGLAIEISVFLTANKVVARPRPSVSHLGGTPSTYSFPSGHTAATMVLYGGIAVLVIAATDKWLPRVLMWGLAVALTVAVAISRIYRGEHYPTDVISGVVLGVGSLLAGIFIIRVASANLALATSPAGADERIGHLDLADGAPQ